MRTGAGSDGVWFTGDDATASVSAQGNPFLYTGRRYDPETQLYYFRMRMYQPAWASFISRDPEGYVDGMSLYLGYFAPFGSDPLGLKGQRLNAKERSQTAWHQRSVELEGKAPSHPTFEQALGHEIKQAVKETTQAIAPAVKGAANVATALTPGVNDARDLQELTTGYDVFEQRQLAGWEQATAGVGIILGSGKAIRTGVRGVANAGEWAIDKGSQWLRRGKGADKLDDAARIVNKADDVRSEAKVVKQAEAVEVGKRGNAPGNTGGGSTPPPSGGGEPPGGGDGPPKRTLNDPLPPKPGKPSHADPHAPDPDATGPHTVIGTRTNPKKSPAPYRTGITYDAHGNPVGKTDVTNHGRGDHTNPHWHPYDATKDDFGPNQPMPQNP